MYCVICSSLIPAFSFSRIWFFKSIASSARESAMVWFWHTRQRNSSASAITRFSSAGSGTAGGASLASTVPARMSPNSSASILRIAVEFPHQRQDLVAHDLRGDGTDALVADHAGLVDDIGFGNPIHAVIDADAAVTVIGGDLVGVSQARQPGESVGALVLVVQSEHRHHAAAREFQDGAVLFAARYAPGCPYVQHPHLAQHILLRNGFVRLRQLRQIERGRRFVDQRRRYLARIERQADAEYSEDKGDYRENGERNQKTCTPHGQRAGAALRPAAVVSCAEP